MTFVIFFIIMIILAISLTVLVNFICTRCQTLKIAQNEIDTAAQDVQF